MMEESPEFADFLSAAMIENPNVSEFIYYHSGLPFITRYLIGQWANGLVVPSKKVQSIILDFLRRNCNVRFIHLAP